MAATTERWRRLESLFEQTIALPPAEREAFIRDRCGADNDLRARLRRMLESDDDGGLLDRGALPASGLRPAEPAATLIGRRIGDFQILRVIASGGMGTVYEAQQEHPQRRVALKVLSAALASPDALRRFEFEAQTLARLQHPAIAAIYESGVFSDDSGARPFFAMELVSGKPLNAFADDGRLDLSQRVQLLIAVCQGVEHAHARGVIHRDLKPANILVEEQGIRHQASGTGAQCLVPCAYAAKILDFGIARAIEPGPGLTLQTSAGQMLGTLAYMSPEQLGIGAARGSADQPGHVDVRSDVYALGVIAYELLGGRTPHDLTTVSIAQAARLIAEREPPMLGTLDRGCRGDLETIVAKALEKEPDRRYQSASHLADDLRRWQAHEPIMARRSSRMYLMRKFARRNRVLVGGALAVLVALGLGVIATTWQWRHAIAQRDAAESAQGRAEDAERLAQARLEDTRRSAGEMMGFADSELASLPGGAVPREAMAVTALELMQRAAESAAASGDVDATTRHLLAYAHQRVGEARLVLGRSADALASHERALEMWRDLTARMPDEVANPRSLAVGHWKMAEALVAMGRVAEAHHHNLEALRLLEDIAARRADSALNILAYPGFAWRRVAETEYLAGRIDAAINAFDQAFKFFDQALAQQGNLITVRRTRATALRTCGDALLANGDSDRAIDAYHRSLESVDGLLAEVGNGNAFESAAAARAHASLALALFDRGDAESARGHIADALVLADRLASADPASFDAGHLQAWCHMQHAELARRCGDNDEALSEFTLAFDALTRLGDHDPDNARVRSDALSCCERLIELSSADQVEQRRLNADGLREHPGVRELRAALTGTRPRPR